ncbi:hypothetical protein [Mucilaginibacter sp. L196]|uniref:hypothetical protein n=1 Tax=Mucilaginibacter sp. L196 TaxID=1641870 RepID=UPI00131C3E6B|nr:hypothetical protein [Mucilaginibacter sp. L196]
MGYIGGDFTEVTCMHPLGSFRYAPKSNEAFTPDKGGLRSNDEANSVTGGGVSIVIINNKRWSIEGSIAVDFVSDNEMGSLNAMAGDPHDGVWTFSHVSGAIWKGTGRPVGEITPDTNTASVKLKVSGGGVLELIS